MEIIIVPSAEDVGPAAAARIAAVVREDPGATIGLATGSSPQGVYADLAARAAAGEISFAAASGFALDEYVGIPAEHPESYVQVLATSVVGPLGFAPDRVHVPDGRATDLAAAARAYEDAIVAAGGIDLQILGVGTNGHIGFNEPTSSLSSRTRIKTLAERTRADNARFFATPEEVPTHCITQGLGTILDAGELLLVANGEAKAAAVAAAVEGPLTSFVPASVLQLHRRATVVVDEAAASRLALADYYRFTYDNKPQWQRW
ncbi:glucosamine-6-phosphate deaminase [Pseudonocardia sp. HH130630-07]|uniref:glucosamine-6-phosphate deaminase n=1 Tax=Pseudonocardia sp. HH130630-07 TaxID=1690815 RepID=UPI000814C3A7|nr:glucosamine-6-phosphate deaminase [Pseudonocardia sp. HH130630-07]ANY08941.1 glucosamine-6-phosphate deaminase [Pseudonocardia sp. HH130630-07]